MTGKILIVEDEKRLRTNLQLLLTAVIEMPPVSNVTALPTSPSTGPLRVRPVVPERDERGLLRRRLRDDRRTKPMPRRSQTRRDPRPRRSRRRVRRARARRRRRAVGVIALDGCVLQGARGVDRARDDLRLERRR